MKIVFFGNPKFASDSLDYLCNNNVDIELVITNPDKRSGRGLSYRSTEVKRIANKHNCKIYETDYLDENLIKLLKSINPDIAIVVAYKFLPKIIYNIPSIATINLHASLLPFHAGASPIQYTLIKGDTESGLTSFIINNKIDQGDILFQKKILINDKITFTELYEELSKIGGHVLVESINLLKNNIILKKQNLQLRTLAPKINKNDFRINWTDTSKNIHNRIRALNYKGAYSIINNKRIKFLKITDLYKC